MLTPLQISTLNNATKLVYEKIYATEQDYFIDESSYENAGLFKWLMSKGTNIDCYILYINKTNSSPLIAINNKIDTIRTIFYAMLKPVQSQFFYWTLLLFIIHKFNFKKPIMKLVLYHYILRTIGDIIDGLGNLLNHYHSVKNGDCVSDITYTEQHPLRWALTRQFNSFFWYIGEIIGDWYPLLRTKAVARDKKSLMLIYSTCILYNISKLSTPISQLFLNPTKLYKSNGEYDKDYVDYYYNYYSCILVVIIASSLIYDVSVYYILRKELFKRRISEFGFMKKFRTISEYRIIVSAIIGVIGLPFTLVTATAKVILFRHNLKDLNFSIEEFRNVVNNVQYMVIFIDQILLMQFKDESSVESYSKSNKKTYGSSGYYYSGSDATSSNYYHSTLNSSNYNSGKYNTTGNINSFKKYMYSNNSNMKGTINRNSKYTPLQYNIFDDSNKVNFFNNDFNSEYHLRNNYKNKESM